jgi:hypothetical protein
MITGEFSGPRGCNEIHQVSWKSMQKQYVFRNFCKEKKRFLGVTAHFLAKMEGKR